MLKKLYIYGVRRTGVLQNKSLVQKCPCGICVHYDDIGEFIFLKQEDLFRQGSCLAQRGRIKTEELFYLFCRVCLYFYADQLFFRQRRKYCLKCLVFSFYFSNFTVYILNISILSQDLSSLLLLTQFKIPKFSILIIIKYYRYWTSSSLRFISPICSLLDY